MREYSADLAARRTTLLPPLGHFLLETLAFAEGRLLTVHPFPDFNGRITRLWLREILRRASPEQHRSPQATKRGELRLTTVCF